MVSIAQQSTNAGYQNFCSDGFCKKQVIFLCDVDVRVARQKNHFHLWMRLSDPTHRLRSTQQRHSNVAEYQVDSRVSSRNFDCFTPIFRLQNLYSVLSEDLGGGLAKFFQVFDEQHRTNHRVAIGLFLHPNFRLGVSVLQSGELDLERGADTYRAVYGDFAAALLDDSVSCRQAQPGAAPVLLGCKEWFKDPFFEGVFNPEARVTDF